MIEFYRVSQGRAKLIVMRERSDKVRGGRWKLTPIEGDGKLLDTARTHLGSPHKVKRTARNSLKTA